MKEHSDDKAEPLMQAKGLCHAHSYHLSSRMSHFETSHRSQISERIDRDSLYTIAPCEMRQPLSTASFSPEYRIHNDSTFDVTRYPKGSSVGSTWLACRLPRHCGLSSIGGTSKLTLSFDISMLNGCSVHTTLLTFCSRSVGQLLRQARNRKSSFANIERFTHHRSDGLDSAKNARNHCSEYRL
jgi:hypothetical protein